MKKLFLILSMVMSSIAYAEDLAQVREDVKQYFLSDDEPKVKDAIWTTPNTFKVGVIDDGTKRDGYAEYVCLELYQRGFKGKNVIVNVIDISHLIKTGKWKNLGKAVCNAN